jgi:hypothetical protein
MLEANVDRVRPHCSVTDLPQRLANKFALVGWDAW